MKDPEKYAQELIDIFGLSLAYWAFYEGVESGDPVTALMPKTWIMSVVRYLALKGARL